MIVTILALAWPTMLEQLMQTAVQYIDTAMVGCDFYGQLAHRQLRVGAGRGLSELHRPGLRREG